MSYFWLISAALLALFVLKRLRAWLYDVVIVAMTTIWYRRVLERLPRNAYVLDVGIGTGSALFNNLDLLREKSLRVTGIDYDNDYVIKCRELIREHRADEIVDVEHVSVYDYEGGPFDAVYFSGSLMIMPDPVAALKHVRSLLRTNGRIYCTQTFEHRRNRLLEFAKPFFKFVTTIDFGQVTYENDFLAAVERADLTVELNENIGDSHSTARSYRLIVLK